ncbi:MAG: hypothetical protein A2092_04825 [Rhodobacteraceae bacterium GWE1_64_9]|nr:MAG: hypothetical protein A2092_04825 [Rhodobacteraceae bacterium GWE1_64_9]OHC48083.1 MAG: hypothetical protein A2X69_02490 [Rhodobacteraceae bacterium GWF1_65_7]HBD90888.1 hypothetical protein [Gemmobacter sp.]HBU15856.1 hypothetical protein [Gemmobacter sp.]
MPRVNLPRPAGDPIPQIGILEEAAVPAPGIKAAQRAIRAAAPQGQIAPHHSRAMVILRPFLVS